MTGNHLSELIGNLAHVDRARVLGGQDPSKEAATRLLLALCDDDVGKLVKLLAVLVVDAVDREKEAAKGLDRWF